LPTIPKEVIRAVREAVDAVEVISRYVTLQPSGSSWKGLCPFHDEKTPSFTVFPASGRYKCFGCNEHGDVFTFLMRRGNLGFAEAVETLAKEVGIPLPEASGGGGDRAEAGRRAAARKALEFATAFYETVLRRPSGERALAYLRGRGMSDATIRRFRLGFAPDERDGLLRYATSKGISHEALFDAGLVRRREEDGAFFDMFRGRVVFPIHDAAGHVIGFGARAMGDAQPKYLNSPDGILFRKGRELYGLHLSRQEAVQAGRILLLEGYTDVILCHQAGVRAVAAGLGTALTSENARTLRGLRVPVVLVYDGDEAGQRAAERAAELLLASGIEGSVAILEGDLDPAELVVARGPEALERAVASAAGLFEYRLARALARRDATSLDGRRSVAEEMLAVVAKVTDPVRRDVAFRLLSERLGLTESTLRDVAARIRISAARRSDATEPPAVEDRWVKAERAFIAAALEDAAIWDRVEDVYPPSGFRDPRLREIGQAISRLRSAGVARVTREALEEALSDEAVLALGALEPAEDAGARATQSLDRIQLERDLERALQASSVTAAVEARLRCRGQPSRPEGA
jgi:DNA primase